MLAPGALGAPSPSLGGRLPSSCAGITRVSLKTRQSPALSDEGTLRLAAHSNNLPQMRLLANELAALNPANAMEKRLANRSEEHTSELQSLMRISYAVFCLKK